MTNRSKATGTATETAALGAAREYFPHAERKVLHGAADQGDLWLLPSSSRQQIVVEVKGGHSAEQASRNQISAWLHEAVTEAYNVRQSWGPIPPDADPWNDQWTCHGFLVTKRKGVGAANAHLWDAHIHLLDLEGLLGVRSYATTNPPVTLTYGWLLALLHERREEG